MRKLRIEEKVTRGFARLRGCWCLCMLNSRLVRDAETYC